MADRRRMPEWVLSKRSRSSRFQNRSCVETNHESSSLATTALVAGTAVAAYAGYIFHRSVQKHGWEGAVRLVWEGDPYEPLLRDAVDTLEESEWDLRATHRIDDRLTGLEESLDAVRAMASSNSKASPDPMDVLWNQAWMEHPANRYDGNPLTIERTLADMSDKLDKIAARVDGVILSSASSSGSSDKAAQSCTSTSNTFLLQQVKARKKQLSMGIVSDMERCDALMASYQVLRERRNE